MIISDTIEPLAMLYKYTGKGGITCFEKGDIIIAQRSKLNNKHLIFSFIDNPNMKHTYPGGTFYDSNGNQYYVFYNSHFELVDANWDNDMTIIEYVEMINKKVV